MNGLKNLSFYTLFLFFVFFLTNLQAYDRVEGVDFVALTGHLNKEAIDKAKGQLSSFSSSKNATLVVEVDSSSGDLQEVLSFAKELYEAKVEGDFKVVVYINGNAIGPAGIIPFISDELIASVFVSWGDIALGEESVLPVNILRSRVRSLVSSKHSQYDLLVLIAEAMADPSIRIFENKGWRADSNFKEGYPIVSPKGETLVIDHHQLLDLGLVKDLFSQENLKNHFDLTKDQELKLSEKFKKEENSFAYLSQKVQKRLKKFIPFNREGPNVIGHISINDKKNGINQSTWIYVRSALEYYKKIKPAFIILELNTPGGEVFSSQQISDALMDLDTNDDIPVIALIDNWAVSAGAMLAYSCRFIGITKDAAMGAAEPVFSGGDGQMQTASEKINSALRTDFANRAGFYDRNPLIAQAMVDKDMILVLRNGKIIKLESEDQIRFSGTNPDILVTAKGKLLTLDGQSMMDYGVVDFMLMPEKLEMLTDQEIRTGQWPAEKSLLFTHSFFQEIPHAEIHSYKMDWKISFFAFLAMPAVSSLLFLGMMIGFYMEMNTPGFGFPGFLALTCLFFVVLSSFSLQAVTWLELIILLAGIGLLGIELFILPGFGIAGILGSFLILIGVFAMMLPSISEVDFDFQTETFNAVGSVFIEKLAWLCGALITGVISIAFLAKYMLPNFTLFNRLVLVGGEQASSKEFLPSGMPSLSERGKVLATLRPSGKVLINEEVYDAMSRGVFIEKGAAVIVVQVEESRIVVEEIEG